MGKKERERGKNGLKITWYLARNEGHPGLTLGWEGPLRRERQPILVFLPEKSYEQWCLACYSQCCCKESDRTQQQAPNTSSPSTLLVFLPFSHISVRGLVDVWQKGILSALQLLKFFHFVKDLDSTSCFTDGEFASHSMTVEKGHRNYFFVIVITLIFGFKNFFKLLHNSPS